MTQSNWYQSIMNDFGLQDCITVTKIGVIANDLVILYHSNSTAKVYLKNVCQIEDKTEYRVIYFFNANLPKMIVSDSMDSLMNKITSLRTKNKVEESTPMNNENSRIPFPFYYLGIAEAVSKRSTCLSKRYGAVIVKDNSIKSTGYNGAPKGRKNCTEIGQCPRITNNIQRGTNYSTSCRGLHSEWNAIINASPEEMKDATLYLYGYDRVAKRIVKDANCCPICKRMIINAGIKDVVIADLDNGIGHPEVPYHYRTIKVADWIENDESLQANEGY